MVLELQCKAFNSVETQLDPPIADMESFSRVRKMVSMRKGLERYSNRTIVSSLRAESGRAIPSISRTSGMSTMKVSRGRSIQDGFY